MDAAAIIVPLVIVVVLVVLFALYLLASRNSLRQLQQRVDEAWRDIEGQVRHRAEILPPLVDVVRGSAPGERTAYEAVEQAREESLAADSPAPATTAEQHLQQALRSVFAVAQSYPQLTASQRFLQLQGDLVETEDRIQASRRFYNGGVREFNTRLQVFPANLIARRSGYAPREFFEVGGSAIAEPPRIQF